MVDWFRGEASKDHAESLAQLVGKEDGSYCWVGQAGMTELSLDLHRHDSQAQPPSRSRSCGSRATLTPTSSRCRRALTATQCEQSAASN